MLGLSTMPSRKMRCGEQLIEHRVQHRVGHLFAALDRVVAIHQHLRLHDRHDVRLLAERGIARQRLARWRSMA